MKCTIGVSGEMTKEFEVAGGQLCRINGAIEAQRGKEVTFVTSDRGEIVADGTGTASPVGKDDLGRDCAKVALANGKSGNICSSPSRAP